MNARIGNHVISLYILALFAIIFLGAFNLFTGDLVDDVSYFLYLTEQLFKGTRLYVDVYDINSPMLYIFNSIPVFIAQSLSLQSDIVFKIWYLVYLVSSVGFASWLLYISRSIGTAKILFIALFTLYFCLFDLYQVGQREQLVLIGWLPYLAYSFFFNTYDDVRWGLVTVVLASVSTLVKPQLLTIVIVVELYKFFFYKNKAKKHVITFLLSVGITISIMLVIFPAYLPMLEEIAGGYIASGKGYNFDRWELLLGNINTYIALLVLWVWFLPFKSESRSIIRILSLLILFSWFVVILQSKGWPYHAIPYHYSLALLSFFLFETLIKQVTRVGSVWNKVGSWFAHTFVILIVCFAYLAPTTSYRSLEEYNKVYQSMERHLKGRSVMFFTTEMSPFFPFVLDVSGRVVGHFYHFWPLPSLYSGQLESNFRFPYNDFSKMTDREKVFFDTVVTDLTNLKPEVLMVNGRSFKQGFGETKFDYIEYFSRHHEFEIALSQYNLVDDAAGYQYYIRTE